MFQWSDYAVLSYHTSFCLSIDSSDLKTAALLVSRWADEVEVLLCMVAPEVQSHCDPVIAEWRQWECGKSGAEKDCV